MILREETANVAEFMDAFEQPIREKPTADVPKKEIALRLKLAFEELTELADATGLGESFRKVVALLAVTDLSNVKIQDFPTEYIKLKDVLDALADIQYINRGTAHTFGLGESLYDGELEAHSSNMTKLDANGKVVKREDGKVIKGENFREPDFQKIIDKYSNK